MANRMLAIIALVCFANTQTATAQDNTNCARSNAGIGEIVTSILKKSDFQNLYGPDWELLDGGIVEQVELLAYLPPELQNTNGKTYLPDARGKFIRMHNNGAIGGEYDSNENRQLGSYQSDTFASHEHDQHERLAGSNCCKEGKAWGDIFVNPSRQRQKMPFQTGETGGKETRPKNIAMNFFIRVSNTNRQCK